ncbi:DUF481 domain-containing protein [Paraglaciecola aquimarina]|uniref:DUF481 domain-containing protein n=1 Tax=Paraglaciecola aquimarina TaxID=1235557 RepID=A0ABU3T0P5_9ALTE|nr:DUF481 domain-containing protein [Paraglaciecola aquimarina]MDU0355821.1 DUF481 domain-containing protein [Paraglaciecola aquimarina]
MKIKLLIILLCFPLGAIAKPNFMRSLYMADKRNYKADDELSMVGELGFILARGNTNASTLKAKINTSQELETWSYQIIADTLYKQSKRTVNGENVTTTSAHNTFLSIQGDYKLVEPENRVFAYAEYEQKRFSGFHYQAAFATGWSSKLWNTKNSELKYSIGPGYAISEIDEGSNKEEQKGIIARAAMQYKKKFSHQATFLQFISTELATSFSKTRSETSLSTKLSGALAMKLSLVLNHETSNNDDSNEVDTQTAVTLVYQFF